MKLLTNMICIGGGILSILLGLIANQKNIMFFCVGVFLLAMAYIIGKEDNKILQAKQEKINVILERLKNFNFKHFYNDTFIGVDTNNKNILLGIKNFEKLYSFSEIRG